MGIGAITGGLAYAALGALALVAALVGGRLARALGLPRLTGYLGAGILLGPSLLGTVDGHAIRALWPIAELAIAFVAVYAGLEMKVRVLRGRVTAILAIAGGATGLVFALVLATKLLLGPSLPVLGALSGGELLLASALVAAVCVTMSPMVTIASISEHEARGPVTSTMLGTTVVVDLLAIVVFAVLTTASTAVWGNGGESPLLAAVWKIGGSLAFGAIIGLAVGWLARQRQTTWVAVALAPALAWAAAAVAGTDLILTALTAGVAIANAVRSDAGERFEARVHRHAAPVFAMFFALAGAKIDLEVFAAVWYVSLLLVGVRVTGLVVGAWLGSTAARCHESVRRYTWLGFVSQAGISFAMAAVVGQTIPGGAPIEAMLIGMIVLHELLGPIATTVALTLSGERGARTADVADARHSGALDGRPA